MDVVTIGLDGEQRTDHEMRKVFTEAFSIVSPCLSDSGEWLSQAHEIMAYSQMEVRFPEVFQTRLPILLTTIANVRAAGRTPVD